MSNRDYESRQSQVIAEQYKMLYENDRKAILSTEPLLDSAMERTLKDVSKDIIQQENIDVIYLKRLTEEYAITGIWLIEGNNKVVHLSSEGIKETDVTQWYKDRPELKWSDKLDWLLNNKGAIWIDEFSKRNTPPHQYLKWGYMGLGDVPQIGGKVILEIGLSLEDAMTTGRLQSIANDENLVSKNIVSVKVEYTDPQIPSQIIKEGQTRNGNMFTTVTSATDFNNQKTKITLVTTFPTTDSTTRGTLIICIGSTLFTLLCLGLLLFGLLKRPQRQ
jgi:hypothetical protein